MGAEYNTHTTNPTKKEKDFVHFLSISFSIFLLVWYIFDDDDDDCFYVMLFFF